MGRGKLCFGNIVGYYQLYVDYCWNIRAWGVLRRSVDPRPVCLRRSFWWALGVIRRVGQSRFQSRSSQRLALNCNVFGSPSRLPACGTDMIFCAQSNPPPPTLHHVFPDATMPLCKQILPALPKEVEIQSGSDGLSRSYEELDEQRSVIRPS